MIKKTKANLLLFYKDAAPPSTLIQEMGKVYQVTVLGTEEDAYENLRSRKAELIVLYLHEPIPRLMAIAQKQAELSGPGIIVMVNEEDELYVMDRIPGVCVLPNTVKEDLLIPLTKQLLYQFRRQRKIQSSIESLQTELADLKIVQRAKLLLMQHLNMDESQAHRYIEKSAMDGCVKRREVAQNIIRTYEN